MAAPQDQPEALDELSGEDGHVPDVGPDSPREHSETDDGRGAGCRRLGGRVGFLVEQIEEWAKLLGKASDLERSAGPGLRSLYTSVAPE